MASRRKHVLLQQWMKANNPDKATDQQISRWTSAATLPERALVIGHEIEPWLQDRSLPAPDLVRCVALYGQTRLMLQYWRLPIDVPPEEYPQWREEGYRMTLEDYFKRLAGVAGGFLKRAGRDPQLFVDTMQQQLEERFTEMEAEANRPLEFYTPRQFSDEDLLDGDLLMETKKFERVFDLRQELICFEWGLEKFRILAMTEQNPAVNLPNMELYQALMQINLNQFLARLHAVDPKLKKILQHLARHNYYRLDIAYMPEAFWWRHWREHEEKQRKG